MSTSASSSADSGSPDTSGGPGKGFKIAAVVLAITTVICLGWAIWATVNYNNEKNSLANEAGDLTTAQSEIKKMAQELGIEKQDFSTALTKAHALRAELTNAQKNESTLEGQLKASQAQTQLASHCASILASGYVELYGDVPTGVTYQQVAAEMAKAAEPCKGIVNITPPNPPKPLT